MGVSTGVLLAGALILAATQGALPHDHHLRSRSVARPPVGAECPGSPIPDRSLSDAQGRLRERRWC